MFSQKKLKNFIIGRIKLQLTAAEVFELLTFVLQTQSLTTRSLADKLPCAFKYGSIL